MRHPSRSIFQHTPESLRAWFAHRGLPPYRAAQVRDWVYHKGVADPALMSNLSKRELVARYGATRHATSSTRTWNSPSPGISGA